MNRRDERVISGGCVNAPRKQLISRSNSEGGRCARRREERGGVIILLPEVPRCRSGLTSPLGRSFPTICTIKLAPGSKYSHQVGAAYTLTSMLDEYI
jgi:hypothetical protein